MQMLVPFIYAIIYSAIKSSSFNILPQSLGEVFMLEFNLRFPSSSSFRKAGDLLSVCLASLQPQSLSDLYHTVSCLYVDLVDSWQEFLATFKGLAFQIRSEGLGLSDRRIVKLLKL